MHTYIHTCITSHCLVYLHCSATSINWYIHTCIHTYKHAHHKCPSRSKLLFSQTHTYMHTWRHACTHTYMHHKSRSQSLFSDRLQITDYGLHILHHTAPAPRPEQRLQVCPLSCYSRHHGWCRTFCVLLKRNPWHETLRHCLATLQSGTVHKETRNASVGALVSATYSLLSAGGSPAWTPNRPQLGAGKSGAYWGHELPIETHPHGHGHGHRSKPRFS